MDAGRSLADAGGMGEDATNWIRGAMPLCATLGVTADRAEAEEVVLAMEWRPELCTTEGVLHGGALMALADSAGATCAHLNLPEGAVGTSTIESGTHFLGRVTTGRVLASARALHAGRSTIVVEVEVRTGGRLVAKVTQTQSVLYPRA